MALTALEQLKLVNGLDGASPDATDLRTLVKASAYIFASDFYDSYKDFDPVLNSEAETYVNKVFSICRQVFRDGADKELFRIIVTIIGKQSFTFAQIVGATDAQWEAFVSANIGEAFEKLADVRRNEKTAYDALAKN